LLGSDIVFSSCELLLEIILFERPFCFEHSLELCDLLLARDFAEFSAGLNGGLLADVCGVSNLFVGIERSERVALVLNHQLFLQLVDIAFNRKARPRSCLRQLQFFLPE
jgi:hypothetical protein